MEAISATKSRNLKYQYFSAISGSCSEFNSNELCVNVQISLNHNYSLQKLCSKSNIDGIWCGNGMADNGFATAPIR